MTDEETTFDCEQCRRRNIPSSNRLVHEARCAALVPRRRVPNDHDETSQIPDQHQPALLEPPAEYWECQHCTFSQNPSPSTICWICESPQSPAISRRPQQELRRGMWSCQTCTYSNDQSASECLLCENPRPPDATYTDRLLIDDNEEPFGWCDNVEEMRNVERPSVPSSSSAYLTTTDTPDIGTQITRGALLGAVAGAAISYAQGRSVSTGALQGASIAALSTLLTHNAANINNSDSANRITRDNVDFWTQPNTTARLHNSGSTIVYSSANGGGSTRPAVSVARINGNFDDAAVIFEEMLRDLVSSRPIGELQHTASLGRDELLERYETGNTPSHGGNAGATDDVINSLPTRVTTAGERASCLICMEDFGSGAVPAVKTLPCLHQYCVPCIDRWLRQSGECPVCKNSV